MRFWILCLFAVSLQALFGVAPLSAQIVGIYETIGTLPKNNSLETVELEEFLNFTCPHCNNFRNSSKDLFAKYGKRINRKNIPILFRNQSDLILRLYYIAEKQGIAGEVKTQIFDAVFKYGVNINDPKVVEFLARSAGLTDQFRKDVNSDWVYQKLVQAQERANEAGVRATPTIVLNRALRLVPKMSMGAFVKNLDRIVEQMLKK